MTGRCDRQATSPCGSGFISARSSPLLADGWGRGVRRPSVAGREGRPVLCSFLPSAWPFGACLQSTLGPAAEGCRRQRPARREPRRSPVLGLTKAQQRGPPDTVGVSWWAAENHTAELLTSLLVATRLRWPSGHQCCPCQATQAGCGGAPSPAEGARRGPSAGAASVSWRRELGCGKRKARSSLCFQALKPVHQKL